MHELVHAFKHALMITSFVFVMMLVIEYINVITSGTWQERMAERPWGQYLLAIALGATPGCLGAFMVVAMYSHRVVSLGALVAAMIVTSGDESFVMLAMIPKTVIMMTGIMAVIALAAGFLVDKIFASRKTACLAECEGLEIHPPHHCDCFPRGKILQHWKNLSLSRAALVLTMVVLVIMVVHGTIGPDQWNWVRYTLMVALGLALFIVSTVPDHFLEEHLWEHVAKRHVPKIFLWTFGALFIIHVLIEHMNLEPLVRDNSYFVLFISALVGIIPESGPHLVFVSMYEKGMIPLSILLTSSIVQDGHGMIPLLAHSRKDFLLVKLINLIIGLLAGIVLMLLGS